MDFIKPRHLCRVDFSVLFSKSQRCPDMQTDRQTDRVNCRGASLQEESIIKEPIQIFLFGFSGLEINRSSEIDAAYDLDKV